MQKIKTIIVFAVFLFLVAACGQQNAPAAQSETTDDSSVENAAEYETFSRVDKSHKATDRPIAAYTQKELDALPDAKHIVYKIVVSEEFSAEQTRPTINKFIADMTEKDKDIDEIELHVYSEESRLSGPYDVAKAVWGVEGRLEKVGPEIATGNKRDDYAIKTHIHDDLEEYLEKRGQFKGTDIENEDNGLSKEDQDEIDRLNEHLQNDPATNAPTPF